MDRTDVTEEEERLSPRTARLFAEWENLDEGEKETLMQLTRETRERFASSLMNHRYEPGHFC